MLIRPLDLGWRRQAGGRSPAVLHVTQPVTEGVGNFVALLIAGQIELDRRVGLACDPRSELAEKAAAAGATVLPWPARREPGAGLITELAGLRRAVARFEPDIVHLHSSKAGLVGRLALRGRLPTVFQPNAWSFEALTGRRRLAAVRWESRAARWTDDLFLVSRHEHEAARAYGIEPLGGSVVLGNPVDVTRFRPATPDERRRKRHELGVADNQPLVGCIGRLCRQKGQDVLLDRWPEVAAAVPEAVLVLVGDGPDRDRLAAKAGPGIRLLGNRTDVAELLRALDVVVLPSRWEGMALTMLEAMATGLPVVTTDVGGAAETVGRGAGAVVPIGDGNAVARAVVARLLDRQLGQREGDRGRELAVEEHSSPAIIAAVDAAYQVTLARRVGVAALPTAPGPAR